MTDPTCTVESVRGLARAIRDHADSIEQERCLPRPVVRGLVGAGVFRMLMPRSLGGDEVDPMRPVGSSRRCRSWMVPWAGAR